MRTLVFDGCKSFQNQLGSLFTRKDKQKLSLSVLQMQQDLGINKIKPILLSDSDLNDRLQKKEDFSAWYEEELTEFYDQNK